MVTAITTSRVSTFQWENRRTQEDQKGWNISQSWEAGIVKEVFLGTETSKKRPGASAGAEKGKEQELEMTASLSQVESEDE